MGKGTTNTYNAFSFLLNDKIFIRENDVVKAVDLPEDLYPPEIDEVTERLRGVMDED